MRNNKRKFRSTEGFISDNMLIELIDLCRPLGNIPPRWELHIKGIYFYDKVNLGDIEYEDIWENTLKYGWFNGMTIPQVLSVVGEYGYYYTKNNT